MPKQNSFNPRSEFGSVNEYLATMSKPKITHPEPFSMTPRGMYGSVYENKMSIASFRVIFIGLVAVGVVLAGIFAIRTVSTVNTLTATPECVEALSVAVDRQMPTLTSLVYMSDDDIIDTLSEDRTIYKEEVTSSGIELVRLPDDITTEDMAAYYDEGLTSLGIEDICKVLGGCWFLSTNDGSAKSVKIKYADFTAGSVPAAIAAAIQEQELLAGGSVLASGTDDLGNTYQYGTVASGDDTLYWKVSSCPLDEVYSQKQLPDNAAYIGVTVSKGALMSSDEIAAASSNASTTSTDSESTEDEEAAA